MKEILGNRRVEEVLLYNNRGGETSRLPVDGVFLAIGYEPTVNLALKIGAAPTPDG